MKDELDILLIVIADRYKTFVGSSLTKYADPDRDAIRIAKFRENLHYEVGRKYIKILKEHSVWGFVVAVDNDKKFRKGDILKAASYNAPARNKARGNILDGGYSVDWTGPHYL